jgi:predicted metalloprotease
MSRKFNVLVGFLLLSTALALVGGCSRSIVGSGLPAVGTTGAEAGGTTGAEASSPAAGSTSGRSELVAAVVVEVSVFTPTSRELQQFWSGVYTTLRYPHPSTAVMKYLHANQTSVCDGRTYTAQDDTGPFYCMDGSDIISVPTAFTVALVTGGAVKTDGDQVRSITPVGKTGIFFLFAHEWGHNVQAELFPKHAGAAPPLELENSADCLAGVAMAGVDREFSTPDVSAVLAFAADIGDSEAGSVHGTPEQRREALAFGMKAPHGDPQGQLDTMMSCFQTYAPTLYATLS